MSEVQQQNKVAIVGAAGLVGQNLTLLLRQKGYRRLVAIDKHRANLRVLESLNSDVEAICADLAESGPWEAALQGVKILVMLQAQITGKARAVFVRNTIVSTRNVLKAAKAAGIAYIVHVSSSVVNSVADDEYTRTKSLQEEMVRESGIKHCVLRPTLMFGWFDPKHLGWLSRFMRRWPVFPVPGSGRYTRQPLYNRDFCRIIEWCIRHQPDGAIYDIVGQEDVDYIDIINTIKREMGLRTAILPIPYRLFEMLLRIYAIFSRQPPFVVDQLKALAAGDHFEGVDMEQTFGIRPTSFVEAIRETFCDGTYSRVLLKRT